jgi:hypothetical protein
MFSQTLKTIVQKLKTSPLADKQLGHEYWVFSNKTMKKVLRT